ncbi:MAG: SBBP repeat-containing protein [Bacteroidales bacterium]|nr:SBBP repeat-containing protein [Bacteroidales bacterium]
MNLIIFQILHKQKLHIFLLFIISTFITIPSTAQNYLWAHNTGGISSDNAHYSVLDSDGNIYVSGNFRDTVDFDPSPATYLLGTPIYSDFFVAKYSKSGSLKWAKKLEGTATNVHSKLSVDNMGNVITTGSLSDTVDLDPGSGVSIHVPHGGEDIFISKLDSNGNFIWAKSFGGPLNDYCYSVITDSDGNVYTTGGFRDTVDFDPNSGVANLVALGSKDMFVSKLDSNGNFVWAKKISGYQSSRGAAMSIDSSGNLIITGWFSGTVDFDPSQSTHNLVSMGMADVFVLKLDSAGDFIWVKVMGGANDDVPRDMKLDGSNNIYVVGVFKDTADFNFGYGQADLISKGYQDIFIVKLNSNGNFVWAKSMGGPLYDYGNSIAVDYSGDVYTTGTFYDTVDFNPGSGSYNISSSGYADIFISKLSSNGTFMWARSVGSTYSEYSNSLNVDIDGEILLLGQFRSTVDFDPGNTVANKTSNGGYDFFMLKLDQPNYCSPSYSSIYASACDSFLWISNNQTYSNSGVYYDTIPSYLACDSIISLHLNINASVLSIDSIFACNSYVWENGTTYFTNNTTDTLVYMTSLGCDSVLRLNLDIHHIDVSCNLSDPSIISNALGVGYQWLDCNNAYFELIGDTNQVFTASINGSYAVEVSDSLCTDTSVCINIISTSLIHSNLNENIRLYPNPSYNYLNIEFGDYLIDKSEIKIYDLLGKLVFDEKVEKGIKVYRIDIQALSPGVYNLQIESSETVLVSRVLLKK